MMLDMVGLRQSFSQNSGRGAQVRSGEASVAGVECEEEEGECRVMPGEAWALPLSTLRMLTSSLRDEGISTGTEKKFPILRSSLIT